MKEFELGFIGCGHMGMCIAKGVCTTGFLMPEKVCVYDPRPEVVVECRDLGYATMKDEKEVCARARIVLLATRPQDTDKVLAKLAGTDIGLLLSIVTGFSIAYLQNKLGDVPVIRAMPNTPLQVGAGSTVLCQSQNCSSEDHDYVRTLFSTMGICRDIPEEKINAMVCVHGSIPAYVYYLTDCILEDMKQRGFEEDEIRDLLIETVIGSGQLMKESDRPLKTLIDQVCSKGGTTIEAIMEMRNRDMYRIIADANTKCINRAEELCK